MDPALWEMVAGDGVEEVAAIVRLRHAREVPEGLRIVARFGDVATCRLRRDAIVGVRGEESVASLKAPRLLAADPPGQAAADDVERRPADERRPPALTARGRGVLIGIADWGCDVAHPDLRDQNGRTRLVGLWDQRGPASAGSDNRYGYGTIHTVEAIDRALAAADPYEAMGYHPGVRAHGTHVAAIAAGSGAAGGPTGLAPDARLAFVHLAATGGRGLANLGDSVSLLEALDYLYRLAGERPCVVNLSVGLHGGPHDGSTLVEQGIDAALLESAGRACCNSTGNYFDQRIHASGRLLPGGVRELTFMVDEDDETGNEIEIWYPGADRFAVEVEPPGGAPGPPLRLGERRSVRLDGERVGRIYHRQRDPNNRDNHIDLFLDAVAPAGGWKLRLLAEDVVDGRFESWIERDVGARPNQARFAATDADTSRTTGTICNGRRTITVGAYDAHGRGRELAGFSSGGPTRDGRQKPDLVAPGVDVLSARSAAAEEVDPAALLMRKSGTSMAAPHVTGTVALMFEMARQPLPIATTRRLLLSSAEPAPEIAEAHRIGSGYLDVERAVRAAASHAQVDVAVEAARPGLSRESASDGSEPAQPTTRPATGGRLRSAPVDQANAAAQLLQPTATLQPSDAPRGEELKGLLPRGELLPAPAAIFDAFSTSANQRARDHLADSLQLVASPGVALGGELRPGDLLVRRGLGEGNLAQLSRVVTGRMFTDEALPESGGVADSARRGLFAQVVEEGPVRRTRRDRFLRRIADRSGRLAADTMVLRPRQVSAPAIAVSETPPAGEAGPHGHSFDTVSGEWTKVPVTLEWLRAVTAASATAPPVFRIEQRRFRSVADLVALSRSLSVRRASSTPGVTDVLRTSSGKALLEIGHFRRDPRSSDKLQVPLEATVCYPADPTDPTRVGAGKRRLPVVAIVHGQHTGLNVDLNPVPGGAVTTESPDSRLVQASASAGSHPAIPSHDGYRYLQKELATHGIVSISVCTNGANFLGSLIQMRAEMVLAALDYLGSRHRSRQSRFHKRLDLNRVGLLGHSRGGDAVIRATLLNARRRFRKYGIGAVVALAPTDFTGHTAIRRSRSGRPRWISKAMRMRSGLNAALLVIYGSHDGDVSGRDGSYGPVGTGFRHYDRSSAPRAMLFLHGATHNRFNTVWVDPTAHATGSGARLLASEQADSAADIPQVGPTQTSRDPRVLDVAAHRELLNEYAGGWFRYWLQRERSLWPLFTGAQANRGSRPVSIQWKLAQRRQLSIDTFEKGSPGRNILGGVVSPAGHVSEVQIETEDLTHIPHQEHVLRAVPVTGTPAAYVTRIPARRSASGASYRDFSRFDALTFRIAKRLPISSAASISSASFPPRFSVKLVDGRGTSSVVNQTAVTAANPLSVRPYHREFQGNNITKVTMETWRLPLSQFVTPGGLRLRDMRRIEITLDPDPGEPIYLDSLSLIG